MLPDPRFSNQSKIFWACVRSLSQEIGYTVKRKDIVKVPTVDDILKAFKKLELNKDVIVKDNKNTEFAEKIIEYFQYRADILNNVVRRNLLTAKKARKMHSCVLATFPAKPSCPQPKNKQKEDKAGPAYLTCTVNLLIEKCSGGAECDYNPNRLTTITKNKVPLRTLARRVDGAFPNSVNPVAIWEIKEYYHTTTFGSRVADGVYESLLDGLELEELRENHKVDIKHYLIVDAYETWWDKGKAYLCRMIDMLHMGYVDEVIFGREVLTRIPILVKDWMALAGTNKDRGDADPAAPA